MKPWIRLFASTLPAIAALTPQLPAFKSSVDAVRVDVLATQGGRPVTGLTPADFQVLDNGVPQQIDLASFERIPVNLAIALDVSSSVQGDRAKYLRSACQVVLGRLEPDEQAALLTFSDAIVMPVGLTHEIVAVRAALDSPLALGETSLADASLAALLLAESQPGRSLVILFSDGIEVSSYLAPAAVLEAVKRSDAVIYALTLKTVGRPPFLEQLTTATGGELLEVGAPRDLEEAFTRVLDNFRHRYLFSYTPRQVARPGWHRIDVRVKRQGVTTKARAGYVRD
jgi:VWFA-related protein